MEIVIIYFWTMLVTSAIGITAKYKGSIFVPTYFKILLILPVRKGEKTPLFLIIIHVAMQLFTVIYILCLTSNFVLMSYREIQTLYGVTMGGVSIGVTLLCSWIFKENRKDGNN